MAIRVVSEFPDVMLISLYWLKNVSDLGLERWEGLTFFWNFLVFPWLA